MGKRGFPPVSRHQASGKTTVVAPGRLAGAQKGSRAPLRFLIPWDHSPFLSWEPEHPASILGCYKELDPWECLAPFPLSSSSPTASIICWPFAPQGPAEGESLGGEAWPWLSCVARLLSPGGTRSESLGSHENNTCLPGCLMVSPGWRCPPRRAVKGASGMGWGEIPGRASPLTEQCTPTAEPSVSDPQGSGGWPQMG